MSLPAVNTPPSPAISTRADAVVVAGGLATRRVSAAIHLAGQRVLLVRPVESDRDQTAPSRSILTRSLMPHLRRARFMRLNVGARPDATSRPSPSAAGASFSAKKRASATRPARGRPPARRKLARRERRPWRGRRRRARGRTAADRASRRRARPRGSPRAPRADKRSRLSSASAASREPRAPSRRSRRRRRASTRAAIGANAGDLARHRRAAGQRQLALSRGRSPGCRWFLRRSRRCARRA